MIARIALATAGVASVLVLAACGDTSNDTTYALVGSEGVSATPDLTFFDDADTPLIHLDLLCNVNGALRYVRSVERSVYDMTQGQTLNAYCSSIGGVRSTDWQVVGRSS